MMSFVRITHFSIMSYDTSYSAVHQAVLTLALVPVS